MPLRVTQRVTQGILYASTLRNLRTASLESFELRNQVSSGRRVQRPSDDPAATLQIMPLRADLRDLEQTNGIISMARHSIDTATSMLEDASSTMARLRELTMQGANGALNSSDRQQLASEVDDLLDQMLAAANATWNRHFVFAGTSDDTAPFELVEQQGRTSIRYHGDGNASSIRISNTFTTEMNVPGDRIFLARNRGATVFEGTTGAAPGGGADSGIGFGTLDVGFGGLAIPGGTTGIAQGDSSTTAVGELDYVYTAGAPPTLSIDGSPPQAISGGVQSFAVGTGSETVSLDVSTPISPPAGTIVSQARLSTDGGQSYTTVDDFGQSYQVVNSVDGTVLNVDPSQMVRIGTERVKFEGTFDAFTTLIAVRDILQNDAGDPSSVVVDRLSDMLPEIDSSHDAVLRGLQELGSRSQNLELFRSRLDRLGLERRAHLSELEDIDLAEAIIGLNQKDLAFQASLQVGARAAQTSLLNFLR